MYANGFKDAKCTLVNLTDFPMELTKIFMTSSALSNRFKTTASALASAKNRKETVRVGTIKEENWHVPA